MKFNASKYNQHWQDKRLKDLGNFQRGKSRHRPRNDKILFEKGIYPLVQTGEIKEANLYIRGHSAAYNNFGLAQSKLWKQGTLCITIAANIAETGILGYPMCFPDSVVGFNAYPDKSSELFMHYVFTYIRTAIQNSASGSIQDNINIDYLTNLQFKIPYKDYQDKIVSILSALDAKIELNNRINAELEAMAKTLYDYWFVQFDFPNENGKPYKSSGGKIVYNPILKREMPEGWEVKKLIELCNKIGDGIHGTPEYVERSNYSFINGNNLKSGFIKIDDNTKRVSQNQYQKYFIELNSNTILLSINGTLGNLALYCGENVMLGKSAAYINCKDNNFPYCYQFLSMNNIQQTLWNIATGSTIKNLSLDALKRLLLPYPGVGIINNFYRLIKPINAQRINMFRENQQLTQLRDWLLPMLMNGQVIVK